jgi:hypothetical protein
MKSASVASKGVAAKKCAIRALAKHRLCEWAGEKLWEGGASPLVVKEKVHNGMKRKEIRAFLLEHNGAATGDWRPTIRGGGEETV